MRKFFLIPLMTLVCSVMAWGTEIVVNDFATLKTQLSASGTADVVKLGQDIAYETNGSDLLNIERSLTLDGQGHSIVGWGTCNVGASIKNVTLAINHAGSADANLDVVIEQLNISYPGTSGRSNGIASFDGIHSLSMSKVNVGVSTSGANFIALLIAGVDANGFDLTIEDSYLASGTGTYPVYILKPIAAEISNTTIDGWCALYFKNQHADYGNTPGSRGSVVTATNCTFNTQNIHNTATNGFAAFPIEDDGITLNLINCSMNAKKFGQQSQSMISLQWKSRTSGFQKVTVNISGDNTHVYNVDLSSFALTGWNTDDDEHVDTYVPSINVPFEFNISGGTFTVDPREIAFHTYVDGTTFNVEHPFIDPEKYEVKEVSQGGNIVYRVVKRAAEKTPGVMYDLNELVSGEGVSEGVNPTSSFEVLADIQLEQETTKAGHVLVTGGTAENPITVTVPADKNLVVNNGLDVEENAEVVVQPGSALLIGEGGIITANTAGIVLNASEENGAALLLHPEINVNNEPTLTVKMYTDSKQLTASPYRYQYHRFAIPVQALTSAPATNYTSQPLFSGNDEFETYVLSWNGSAWVQENSWTGLQPFTGYLLANNTANGGITYTFTGKLYGNTNDKCEFTDRGFGYFGNSYTAPIYINNFLAGFGEDLEGSVWVYDYTTHNFKAVNATASVFEDAVTEIAPMQSFVLNLPNATTGEAVIDYSSAIWGNPRFDAALGRVSSSAPARSRKAVANASRIKVVAENGMADEVTLIENDTYSAAFENGADATKFIFEEGINLYATTAEGDLSIVATDNLENSSLSFKAGKTTNYTLVVDKAIGEDYAIRDNVTNAVINCAQGAEYTFTQAANSTAIGRFEIVDRNEVPTAIENTEVKANVQGIYTITGMYLGEDLNALPAGVYVVNGVKIVK